MASIIKKTVSGKSYYYYVEMARIDGKPKRTKQVYLGSAESIIKNHDSQKPMQPLHSEIEAFADVCALYDLAQRLSLVEMLDQYLPKRNQGISLGIYTLIAAINRAVSPLAKMNIAQWYSKTTLKTLLPVAKSGLACQRFWDNMDIIEDKHIQAFEEAFLEEVLEQYPIDTTRLIYDATNFFTFQSPETDSDIAKKGHGKDKGTRLKIVGLSMMITPDFNMPLLYDVYPGNRHDSKEFYEMIVKMQERYTMITKQTANITISFDKGNNAEDVIDQLENGRIPFHYIGALRLSQISDMLDIPIKQYHVYKDEYSTTKEKTRIYRTEKMLYGRNMTVLITFNPRLFSKHLHTYENSIAKTEAELAHLQQQLNERAMKTVLKGRQMTAESVSKRLREILSRDHMSKVFITNIEVGDDVSRPRITYSFDKGASDSVATRHFGKRAFFTSQHKWQNEEIVGAYDSAWHVEGVFRQMKNPHHLPVRPIFHWTDSKIKIHIFFCVLAYRLCCILNHELKARGVDVSINKMLDSLAEVKRVVTIFSTNKSDILVALSKGDKLAEGVLAFYDLRAKYLT